MSNDNFSVETEEEVTNEVLEKRRKPVSDFIKNLRKGSTNGQQVITIDELDQNWDILDKETRKIYAEAVGEELSRINEKPLIDSKKENSN